MEPEDQEEAEFKKDEPFFAQVCGECHRPFRVAIIYIVSVVLVFCFFFAYGGRSKAAYTEKIKGTATFYCPCTLCNGKNGAITADGTKLDERTGNIIACNWLKLGTKIKIDGVEYRVADRGDKRFKKVGRVDIFVYSDHDLVEKLGIKNIEIEVE